MATPKSQRIGIWIIAIVMVIGTLGSFAVMVLGNENDKIDQAEQNKLLEEYQKQIDDEKKRDEELASKSYPLFKKYQDAPASYDMKKVGNDVEKKDLVVGDGAKIEEGTTYKAYYIGWNPKGKTFDSSFADGKLKEPLNTSVMDVIPGWKEGVIGMKVGGIREITIPSDLAYGESGQGNDIPPNTPIKFIVMIAEKK